MAEAEKPPREKRQKQPYPFQDADFRTMALFATAVKQIEELTALRPIERIVEIGSATGREGPGRFLAYLSRITGLPVVGSDSAGVGLDLARHTYPHIAFLEASPLEMVRRHGRGGALFVAMNVPGKLAPADVQMLFDGIDTAITFAERGVLVGEGGLRPNDTGWDHNYVSLLRGFELLEMTAMPHRKLPEREVIVATAFRA